MTPEQAPQPSPSTLGEPDSFLGKRPCLQVVLSIAVASAVLLLLFPGQSVLGVVVRVAVSSLGGIAVMVLVRRREQRAAGGSADRLVSLDRKLRRGVVPSAPQERQAMRDLVEQRLRRSRHRVAAQVFLAVMFCAVVVLAAVTASTRQTIGMALFSGAFLGWLVLYGSRRHRRLRAMRTKLAGGTASNAQP
ncbi:hypothetical protein [Streptomyces sp. NPDC002328]|uniref:hypothetical protein n=1 Tax=Streptomyces sp. NPDC002328 TaxID=3364642 RepID=UPI00369CA715